MIEVKGKYNEARIFTDTVDSGSVARVDKIVARMEYYSSELIELLHAKK